MSQRIKGQETSIIVTTNGVVEDTLTDIQNFGITIQTELIQQGYLGQTTDQFDEVFKGAKFDMEMHTHSQDYLSFQLAIINRARRVTPDTVFNIVTTLDFPNGDSPTVTLPDVKFGPLPNTVPGRAEYLKVKVEGACSEPDIELS